MPAESAAAVLHITTAVGGGADRYIRDLAANTRRRHFVLHAGAGLDVLEDLRAGRYVPLRAGSFGDARGAALASWIPAAGVGIAHVHGMDEACRARLAPLVQATALPYVATLHDLQFVNPRAFDRPGMPEPVSGWIADVAETLDGAATVITPSAFILDVALACARGIRASVIPPGIQVAPAPRIPPVPTDYAADAPQHVVAVVGAIGPHKGSAMLEDLAAALVGSGIGIVVIGYSDTRLARGWVAPGSLYMHGPYLDDELAGWLAAYRVETVLFPNRLPESFSYTLSEVWAAGLPVIVPEDGALGERVARQGGGWRLPAGFASAEAAAILVWLLSTEGAVEHARVKSQIAPGDAARIPTLEAMSREIDALYARFAQPAEATNDDAAREALTPLLAANLDGFQFRKELINFASELASANARLADAMAWCAKLEANYAAAAARAAQVERDSTAWIAKLDRDSRAWTGKLEGDIASLKVELERLADENRHLADHKAAFDLLPELVRKSLTKRAFRARR